MARNFEYLANYTEVFPVNGAFFLLAGPLSVIEDSAVVA